MQVEITDDSFRRILARQITQQMRLDARIKGIHIPDNVHFILERDRQGHKIQEKAYETYVFEGARLARAIRRAKRWIRSRRYRSVSSTPRHIALAMAAFHKADPEGFARCLHEKK